MTEVFDRRGPMICIMIERPGPIETWVPFALWFPTKRFVRVPCGWLRWNEFEEILGHA